MCLDGSYSLGQSPLQHPFHDALGWVQGDKLFQFAGTDGLPGVWALGAKSGRLCKPGQFVTPVRHLDCLTANRQMSKLSCIRSLALSSVPSSKVDVTPR